MASRMVIALGLALSSLSPHVALAQDAAGLPRIPRLPPPSSEPQPSAIRLTLGPGTDAEPEWRPTLPVYRAVQAAFTTPFIQAFMNVAFGARPEAPPTRGDIARATHGNLYFRFAHRTGRIMVMNTAFEEQVKARRAQGPSVTAANAAEAAQRFLESHHLWREGATYHRTVDNTTGTGTFTVVFARMLPGLPYPVWGNRIECDLSPVGVFHSVSIEWTDLRPVAEYPILKLSEAVAQVNLGKGIALEAQGSGLRGKVVSAKLRYLCNPARSGYVQPIYHLSVARDGAVNETVSIQIQAIRPEFISEESEKADEVPGSGPAGSKSEQEAIPSEGPASKPPG